MIKQARKCFCVGIFLLLGPALQAAAQDGPPKSVEGELMVKFRGGPRGEAAAQAEQALGLEVRRRFDRLGWQHVRLRPGENEAQALARLRQRPDVIAAEPNYVFQLRLAETPVPNDPRFSEQWALPRIGASNAWALTTGSSNVVVAVLDTGIRYTHEDLAANMWRNPGEIAGNGIDDDNNGYVDDVFGIDAVNQDSDPTDQPVSFIYHGTACASIIGAVGNNSRGIVGLNWPVRLMALRLASTGNLITSAWATECFEYVLMMKERGVNVRVTSNSYGLDDAPSQAIRDAIDAVGNAGVLSVFAAGNQGKNVDVSCDYPACFRLPGMLNVAATDTNDVLATFSNYGATNVDLAAPGVNITIADGIETNVYNGFFSGTSAACPYVAGAAALLAGAYPSATVAEIKAALMATVDFLPSLTNKMVSHGRLNVGRAIFHAGLSTDAPPNVLTPPLSQTVGLGYPATFCVIATGAQPLDFFWQFEGSQIAHTTEPVFTRPNIQLSHAGNYGVILSNAFGITTSAVATLTVVTNPTILAEPQGLRALDGTNVSFEVKAAGAYPLSIQWQRNGAKLPGETNATIAFVNTQGTMTGDYRAVLTNSYGSVTTALARLTVLTRPHVIVQPQSQTVAVGANVTLSVTVTDAATLPIGYRWRFMSNQVTRAGAVTVLNEFTHATNLLNIQTNLSGIWSALLTNESPSGISILPSSNAYVTIVIPPTNKTVLAGANAAFSVIATGPGTPAPIRYQWQRNGTNIPNATANNVTLTSVQAPDAGNVSVVVSNAIGQPATFTAFLQVVGPPSLTQAARLPDGTFRTILTGLVSGQQYVVEVSTNLVNWDPRPPLTASGTSMPFIDTTAPQSPQRFYRARSSLQ
jgi:subtilisin family serine protease